MFWLPTYCAHRPKTGKVGGVGCIDLRVLLSPCRTRALPMWLNGIALRCHGTDCLWTGKRWPSCSRSGYQEAIGPILHCTVPSR